MISKVNKSNFLPNFYEGEKFVIVQKDLSMNNIFYIHRKQIVPRRRRTSTFPQRQPKIVKIGEIAVPAYCPRGGGCHPQRQPKFVKISVIFNFIISIQQYSLVFEVLKAAS